MQRFPTVITTSVVRSAYQGESHGGIYLVNLANGKSTMKVDWNNCDIDWQGRGGDRGLRGIAFHDHEIYIAASDEIIIYNKNFCKIRTLRNRYLRYCHEIFILKDTLYLTSTGFDSILLYDIRAGRFLVSYCARLYAGNKFSVDCFDPNSSAGPPPGDTLHLNSVYVDIQGLHIAGHQMPFIVLVGDTGIWKYGTLPPGTHNARPYNDGLLYNNTAANCISLTRLNGQSLQSFPVVMFDDQKLLNNDLPDDHARQGFCRGLCLINNGEFIVGGSSPSTLSVYSMPDGERVRQVTISMDKRNAIHGLEIWPFS